MSKHQIEVINNNINLPQECRCDEHLKVIDFICLTCQLQICSICAIGNHRPHDIHPLEKYVRFQLLIYSINMTKLFHYGRGVKIIY